jgi:hypothetical protein
MNEKILEGKIRVWREKLEETEAGKTGKLWGTVKCLMKGRRETGNETMIVDGRELRTERQKANSFIQQYAEVSKIKKGKTERKKRVEVAKRLSEYEEDLEYEEEFVEGELKDALGQLKANKKGGCDMMEPIFFKKLTGDWESFLLRIINKSWTESKVPGCLKKAQIIPILKEGKNPKERDSYRPVCLTPVMAKVMERMVSNRMAHCMVKKQVVNRWQTGFQRGKAVEDQIIRVSQSVQDGFEKKPYEKTILVALDCTKAYDRVWKVRLVERMMDEKAPKSIIMWMKAFLEDRKTQVKMANTASKWKTMSEGLSQGTVSSPMLLRQ